MVCWSLRGIAGSKSNIGITSLVIGIMQAIFLIRPAREAFHDFMDPSVLFIFGSLIIGMVFTKVGLTKRLAYKMLTIAGERTSMIYLGCFIVTALLTHFMVHTAVAAIMFPILMAIYTLYGHEGKSASRFGKGLFIGMAFVAGAGSMITLLGAARGAVAIGFLMILPATMFHFLNCPVCAQAASASTSTGARKRLTGRICSIIVIPSGMLLSIRASIANGNSVAVLNR